MTPTQGSTDWLRDTPISLQYGDLKALESVANFSHEFITERRNEICGYGPHPYSYYVYSLVQSPRNAPDSMSADMLVFTSIGINHEGKPLIHAGFQLLNAIDPLKVTYGWQSVKTVDDSRQSVTRYTVRELCQLLTREPEGRSERPLENQVVDAFRSKIDGEPLTVLRTLLCGLSDSIMNVPVGSTDAPPSLRGHGKYRITNDIRIAWSHIETHHPASGPEPLDAHSAFTDIFDPVFRLTYRQSNVFAFHKESTLMLTMTLDKEKRLSGKVWDLVYPAWRDCSESRVDPWFRFRYPPSEGEQVGQTVNMRTLLMNGEVKPEASGISMARLEAELPDRGANYQQVTHRSKVALLSDIDSIQEAMESMLNAQISITHGDALLRQRMFKFSEGYTDQIVSD